MRTLAFVISWCVALSIALAWVLRPATPYVPPAGWYYWPDAGAVMDLMPEPDGTMLIGGKQGLMRLTASGDVRAEPWPGPDLQRFVYAIERDGRGRLWVGHEHGASVFDGERWLDFDSIGDEPLGRVRALLHGASGLWVGASTGLYHWRSAGEALSPAQLFPRIRDVSVRVLLEDVQGAIWVGTTDGLFRLGEQHVQRWGVEEGLPNRQVASLLQAANGTVWVGTGFHTRGGTVVFEGAGDAWKPVRQIPQAELAAAKTRSLLQHTSGRIWLGSETGGLAIRERGRTRLMLTADDGRLPDPEVTVMRQTSDDAVWLGTLNGLLRIEARAVEQLLGGSD